MSMDMKLWKCFCALKKLLPICCLYSRKEADCGTGASGPCDPTQLWDQTLTNSVI